jgi:uncharacterized protein YjiS (DUF1127 family)
MSDQIANSQLTFRLPSLSYIDVKWEEPELWAPSAGPGGMRKTGLVAWLSRRVAAVVASHRNHVALSELSAMSNRELADIGLSRSDLARAFDASSNRDLCRRITFS